MGTKNEQLKALISAAQTGPAALNLAMQRIQSEFTPELAEKAGEESADALARKDLNTAMLLATISSEIYNRVSKPDEGLKAYLDFLGLRFLTDNTEADYTKTFAALVSTVGDPRSIRSAPVGLSAMSLAADCAYFAGEAAINDESKVEWMSKALNCLHFGSDYLRQVDKHDDLVARYVSVVVAVYQRCEQRRWSTEPWALSALTNLTVELDKALPENVYYFEDAAKTAKINSLRVQLSATYNHGAFTGARAPKSAKSGFFGPKKTS